MRHARAIALLPGTVTIVVPVLILLGGTGPEPGFGTPVVVVLGALLIAAGFAFWVWTVRLLARIGKGTLAPWDPTQRLVVEGPYRYVRNPMITAVLAVLLGETLVFGSLGLLVWCGVFVLVNWAYFALVEEPGLESRFGDEYSAYRRAVPRWLPRRTPWAPGG
jgi:protein-S-isoprenylcysteine O-methyltransferase Ste14